MRVSSFFLYILMADAASGRRPLRLSDRTDMALNMLPYHNNPTFSHIESDPQGLIITFPELKVGFPERECTFQSRNASLFPGKSKV